mmetsp:Transcript_4249/g.6629  ORF Transcript_4249/g.6629 Transcript_4249/m.6629 type:complete len:200 (-) Transcript_4249:194-793(-)
MKYERKHAINYQSTMRRNRIDVVKDGEMLVSETPMSHESVPSRKRRRTILETFQSMTLKSQLGEISDEGNSSCATGGSRNAALPSRNDDDTVSSANSNEILSDQEKAQRAMAYQLAIGRTYIKNRNGIVADRLEKMIRTSRRQAETSTDDINIKLEATKDSNDMDVDESIPLKRSTSLPKNFEGPVPPVDTIEVELKKL